MHAFCRCSARFLGALLFALWLYGQAVGLSEAAPAASASSKETPLAVAAPRPTPAPASGQPVEKLEWRSLSTLGDLIDLSKRCCYDLLDRARSASSVERGRIAVEAARAVEAVSSRLKQIDFQLKSAESHWTWLAVTEAQLEESSGRREKFIVDPPVDNASAVAFSCKGKSVRVESVKVIDSAGGSTVFPLGREFSSRQKAHEACYLYYPSSVSTIIVEYGNPGGVNTRLNVWTGVTDLPEYAKEAIYWLRLALQELQQANLEKASDRIKQAIVKVTLYRESRNRL